VPWSREWANAVTYTGHVRVTGGSARPFVIPVYGLEATSDSFGPRVAVARGTPERIALGPQGTYEIAAGAPAPDMMLVCIPTPSFGQAINWEGGSALIVETILPGESCDIVLGTLDLQWNEAPAQEGIAFELERSPLRHSVSGPAAVLRVNWDLGAGQNRLILHNVPVSTNGVLFTRYTKNPKTGERSSWERRIPIRWDSDRHCKMVWSQDFLERYPFVLINSW